MKKIKAKFENLAVTTKLHACKQTLLANVTTEDNSCAQTDEHSARALQLRSSYTCLAGN